MTCRRKHIDWRGHRYRQFIRRQPRAEQHNVRARTRRAVVHLPRRDLHCAANVTRSKPKRAVESTAHRCRTYQYRHCRQQRSERTRARDVIATSAQQSGTRTCTWPKRCSSEDAFALIRDSRALRTRCKHATDLVLGVSQVDNTDRSGARGGGGRSHTNSSKKQRRRRQPLDHDFTARLRVYGIKPKPPARGPSRSAT